MRLLRAPVRPSPLGTDRDGFTLVELVVSLLIVGAAAGLVIPAVAGLGRTTDMAASAKTQQDVSNNLQQFFTLQKRFPQGLDSLLIDATPSGSETTPDSPGTADGAPDAVYGPKYDDNGNQVSGLTESNPNLVGMLTLGTLTSNQRRSFTRAGFDWVYDHEVYDWTTATGELNANNSAIFERTLPGSGTMPAAVLNEAVGQNMSPTSGAYLLLRGLVPAELESNTTTPTNWDWNPEDNTQIVAVGVGNRSRLVPTTMMNTPIYPGNEGSYYGRFVAFFKVFESGERAVLIGVSDPYGRTSDYTLQQFAESLPNGARQG
jgi:prepilin-type N-terminal cleavage/methylation domain-containing protein